MQGGGRLGLKLLQGLSSRAGSSAWGSQVLGAGEVAPFGARNASQLIVKNRMKSVKNIQKITKAMKMVAASKLRAAQQTLEKSRPIWQPFTALLGDVPAVDVQKNLTIIVTSDKGLCGGINSAAVKYGRGLTTWIGADNSKEKKYVVLGEKGKAQLLRSNKKEIAYSVTEYTKQPANFTMVSNLVDDILKNVEFDAARIVFNHFNSVIAFKPTVSTVVSAETLVNQQGEGGNLEAYEFEGAENGGAEFFQDLAEFQLATTLFNAILENATSEQGARMSAMDSSTRNASDMLDRLTLSYNRSRQASITTELIEIISGAAALEAAT